MIDPFTRKAWVSGKGYLMIWVPGRGKVYLHRAVWEFHHGPIPPGMEINHDDGNKQNNTIGNLQLVTRRENQQHAMRNGLLRPPPQRSHRKLKDDEIRIIRREHRPYKVTSKMLAARFGVSAETVARIIRGEAWANVS